MEKLSYNFVNNSFVTDGYILVTKEYINNKQKLEYICPDGHIHSIVWNSWQQGVRCPYCFHKRNSGDNNYMAKNRGKKHPNYGKKHSEETKRKMSIAASGSGNSMYGRTSPNKGKTCPEEMRKQISETLIKNGTCAGSNNANWKGGVASEPYCSMWNSKEWRSIIYDRDKDKYCWNPQCLGIGNKETFHHIDYNKKNCRPDNIIKVCNSCNSVANGNREWWQSFYTTVMYNRFK